MAFNPNAELAASCDLAWRFGVVKLQVVIDRVTPLNIAQNALLHLKAQRFLRRIVWGELNHCSVSDKFLDHKPGVLRIERYVAAKRRDEHVATFGSDSRNTFGDNPGVAAFNGQLVDGNESPLVRAMMKLDSFENASREGKISAMRTADGDGAVTRFRQILHDGFFGKRPKPAP